MNVIALPAARSVALGSSLGFAKFLYTVTAAKICRCAGVRFERTGDIDFWSCVVTGPIQEEMFFRGMLQPVFSLIITLDAPQLAEIGAMGISRAGLISSFAIGILFGILHITEYTRGGKQAAAIAAVGGIVYGLANEWAGIMAPISAHMLHNFSLIMVQRHYPKLLNN